MSDHSRSPCDTIILYSSHGFGLDYSHLPDIILLTYNNFPSPDPQESKKINHNIGKLLKTAQSITKEALRW